MKFIAEIDVMPQKEILDPQGKAVKLGLNNLGIVGVENVRVGKHMQMIIEADSKDAAEAQVEVACKKLLANLIMEDYTISISAV
jgi:phosphoribosylformylglycinamidine synthase subunit PurS